MLALQVSETELCLTFLALFRLYAFVEASPVRHAVMEKISKEVGTQLKSLKSLSTTRWACRAEAVARSKTKLFHYSKGFKRDRPNKSFS